MLKPFVEVMEPDPRYAALVVLDEQGGFRPMRLADHYAAVAEIGLGTSTPKEARTIFDRARHAFLYAWFDYELTPLAEGQAFAALESGLRQRLGKGTLKPLLDKAVKEKLVPAKLGELNLPFAVSQYRNHHAHGSDHFGSPGMTLDVLRLVADLLRGIYP